MLLLTSGATLCEHMYVLVVADTWSEMNVHLYNS